MSDQPISAHHYVQQNMHVDATEPANIVNLRTAERVAKERVDTAVDALTEKLAEKSDKGHGHEIAQIEGLHEAIAEIIENQQHTSVLGQTLRFQADGTSLQYDVPHNLNTKEIIASAYNDLNGEKIILKEIAYYADRIVLKTTAPLPDGMAVRVTVVGVHAAVSSGEGAGRREHVHEQKTAETEWSITHSLGVKHPKILILDDDGGEIVGEVQWETATVNYIAILFCTPVSGKAIVTN